MRVASLASVGLAIFLSGTPLAAEEVTCKATKAVACARVVGGCQNDRLYTVKFTVNRQAKSIVDGDGNVYKILPIETSALLSEEYAIQAFAEVGSAATETIVLGEQSFVSSNVSVSPPRAYVQIGTCSGLRRR